MGDFEYRFVRDMLWSLRRTRRVSSVRDLADVMGVRSTSSAELAKILCGFTRGLSPPAVEAALADELGSSVCLVAVRAG